jgi:hypothetical protein
MKTMRVLLVVALALVSLGAALAPLNEAVDIQNDAVTNAPSSAAGERVAALSEEERLTNLAVQTERDARSAAPPAKPGSAVAAAIPSNKDGILPQDPSSDLKNKDSALVDPEAAKNAINGITSGQDTANTDADQQASDEESEDRDDDDEARWEKAASAAMDKQVKATVAVEKVDIVDNSRQPDWPLALKASPRLPVTQRELTRSTIPRDLALAFDWRGRSTERTGMRFPHTRAFDSPDWTISFWLNLEAHTSKGSWKALLVKGHNSRDRSPGVWVSNANRLWVRLMTDHHVDEGFHSVAAVPEGVPTHIAIVRRDRTFALFINGNLDSHMVTIGRVLKNDGPVHISRSPGYLGFNGQLYGLRWYSRGQSIAEIRANSAVGTARPVASLAWNKRFTNDDLDSVTLLHDKSMESDEFTVAFWLTLAQDSTGTWRSVFHKGGLEAMTPSCFLMPNQRRLSCHISTTHAPDEQIVSKAIIPLDTPTHIALVRQGRLLSLYVDGVLDVTADTVGYTAHNAFQLSIGTSRWAHKGKEYSAGFVGQLTLFTWVDAAFNIVEVRRNMEREAPRPVLQLDTRIDYKRGDRVIVPHLKAFKSQAFTVSFWASLREESPRKANRVNPDRDWNMILRKGSSEEQNTPSVWYRPSLKASKIQVRISTTHSSREMFDSVGSVRVNTPTRIALTLEGKVLKLYIDDKEDSVFILRGVPVENFGPVYFGSDLTGDGAAGQLEDLRWYNRPLSHVELLSVSPHGLFRYWTPPLVGGPAVRVENSVSFSGFNMMSFPDSNLRSNAVTVSFWITLKRNADGVTRAIFGKGDGALGTQMPQVTLDNNNRLVIRLQTTHDLVNGESKTSAQALSKGSPFHIAFVMAGRDVKLFVNGALDTYFTTLGDPVLNDSPWRVGKSTGLAGVVGRISQFRIYTHAVSEDDIVAIADGGSKKPVLDFRWNGAFDGTSLVKIPHNSALDSPSLTVTCWITVTEAATGTFRVIWQKGDSNNQRTPSMALRPNSNMLQASVSTSRLAVEVLTSEHILAVGVPTLVTYVLEGREQRIYINGILDSSAPIQGDVIFNQGPLTVGKSVWGEGFVGKISALSVYSRALDDQEIREFAAAVHVPSVLSFDAMGKFDGRDMMVVPHSPIFDSNTYTVAFWLTLRAKPSTEWSTILHKGSKNSERAPGIFLYPGEHKLYFAVSTVSNSNAGMTANTTLVQNVPTHVAMTVVGNEVKVYLDAVLQGTLALTSPILTNTGPLYLMRDLWYSGTDAVLTGFRVLPNALDAASIIQAMAKDERY